ncbi:hypothetical protein NEF87_001946 [Candidatus Lokiarchaeum ossiferum]|uniref:DUF86 domain-containing protein n=1 Tax=Candidatus Lokiarchaeum ossiferum TaxID=2951803 RepID=A0ABY6HSY0_9ARCH|nr:hypothetical protein NEF87_001946 [Candidatus Lokiarchaeum sp. B-35]
MEALKEIMKNANLIMDEIYWKNIDSEAMLHLKNAAGESLTSINLHLLTLLKVVQNVVGKVPSEDDILDDLDLILDHNLHLRKKKKGRLWKSKT